MRHRGLTPKSGIEFLLTETMGGGMRTKQTPLHDFHVERYALMVLFAGSEMPLHCADGIKTEHLATLQSAGLFELSHMAQLEIGDNRATAIMADDRPHA